MSVGRHRRPSNVTRKQFAFRGSIVAAVISLGALTTGAVVSAASDPPGTVYLSGPYVCTPGTSPTPTPTSTVPVTSPPVTTPPPTTPPPTTTPPGSTAPVGDLPGWHQTFLDDFNTPAAQGDFLAKYPGWWAYPVGWHDTSGAGQYNPYYLSTANGLLNIHLSTVNGVPQVNAPEPNGGRSQTYGRYTERFRATANGGGYKTAWLLWSDAKAWPSGGEIDFPEGDLLGSMWGFAHYADPNGGQDAFNTGVGYSAWHTATIEWVPGRVTFYLDGKVVGTSTHEVPSGPMRFVLQTETDGGKPATSVVADVQIDWVSLYSYAP